MTAAEHSPTDAQRAAIVDAIDDAFDRQVQFTRDLVATPSLRGEEGAAQDAIETAMRSLGLSIDRWTLDPDEISRHEGAGAIDVPYEGSDVVVGTFEPAEAAGRSLILNGHVDVVPTGEADQWSRSPWEPAVEDGWLYGRGSGDMKAGLVANLFAFEALAAAGLEPAGRVHLQSVPEEESTGNGTLSALQHGYVADTVLFSEPSGQRLSRTHVGVIWFTVRVRGRAAHAFEIQNGTNAIDAAYGVIAQLREMEARWNEAAADSPTFGEVEHPLNLNIGGISAGGWPSSVPDSCEFSVRVSLLPETDVNDAWQEIVDCVEGAPGRAASLAGTTATVRKHGFFSNGYTLEPGSAAEDALAEAHRSVAGEDLDIWRSPGYIDSRVYGLFAGVPSLVYGPIGERLHGADERVDLASLRETTKTIALFMAGWCGVRERRAA